MYDNVLKQTCEHKDDNKENTLWFKADFLLMHSTVLCQKRNIGSTPDYFFLSSIGIWI